MRFLGYVLGLLGSYYASALLILQGPFVLVVLCFLAVLIGGVLIGKDTS